MISRTAGARRVAWLIMATLMLGHFSSAQQVDRGPVVGLTADQVVSRLEGRNCERANALHNFEGSRTYHLQYRGFPGSRDADMMVKVDFQSPATKRFKILSQTGSKFFIDHILMKLLESEEEALREENRQNTAVTRENYAFLLAGYEPGEGGRYVLEVTPRSKNKFLYRGRIWVDATDFAVTHIEGEPAKSPSFWVKKTSIRHQYAKFGDFWLPLENRTESQVRLGGTALLTIEYTNYRINSAAPIDTAKNALGAKPESTRAAR